MNSETRPYLMYGAPVSYYSGKLRSYLLHKGIPFEEKAVNAWHFLWLMPRRVKTSVIPVLKTPSGEWLQDTSVMMDELERRFPEPPVNPATPVQRLVAYLFEIWGDEFWLPLAMHTRWNRTEQIPWYAETQVGPMMLPGWPKFMQRYIGHKTAGDMSGFVDNLGFGLDMAPVLDRFGDIQLDGLNAHFAEHKFLLGDRPCMGDYGLIGPLYAHIGRDPLSSRDLIDTRPHLKAWIQRMFEPATSTGGEFLPDDRIPETLMPALRSIFDEMLPFIRACADAVREAPVVPADSKQVQRFMGTVSYPMAGGIHKRKAAGYPVWMTQRLLDVYRSMPATEQQQIKGWLHTVGGEALLQLNLPQMQRSALAAVRVA